MRIGFTGTRQGMTLAQRRALLAYLMEQEPDQFHHGDCQGADAQAHQMAILLGFLVNVHPPSDPKHRAFCEPAARTFEPAPYLERNRHIVTRSDLLLAAPGELREQLRSGTWSTVRYARSIKRGGLIFYPDGTQEFLGER